MAMLRTIYAAAGTVLKKSLARAQMTEPCDAAALA
jgi:hypothetical protein